MLKDKIEKSYDEWVNRNEVVKIEKDDNYRVALELASQYDESTLRQAVTMAASYNRENLKK